MIPRGTQRLFVAIVVVAVGLTSSIESALAHDKKECTRTRVEICRQECWDVFDPHPRPVCRTVCEPGWDEVCTSVSHTHNNPVAPQCTDQQDLVGSRCVPKCPPPKMRAGNGECACPVHLEPVGSQCLEPCGRGQERSGTGGRCVDDDKELVNGSWVSS